MGKIKHVVIIVKENHTFDNYFGTFSGANGAGMARSPNPPARDSPHTHAAWLTRQTTAVREQFIEQDIPAYFSSQGSSRSAITTTRTWQARPHRIT